MQVLCLCSNHCYQLLPPNVFDDSPTLENCCVAAVGTLWSPSPLKSRLAPASQAQTPTEGNNMAAGHAWHRPQPLKHQS